MIITRTPLRVSLFGGGTDTDWFSRVHGGEVLSLAINKYIYITSHPMFETRSSLLKYSELERVNSADQIKHRIFREVFLRYAIEGIDVGVSADIPAGTGLGSSSAFTVGLLQNVHRHRGNYPTKEELAREACHIEIEIMKQPIGRQDQYAAAVGGINRIKFNKDGTTSILPLALTEKQIESLSNSMLLVKVGTERSASELLTQQRKLLASSTDSEVSLLRLLEFTRSIQEEDFNDLSHLGDLLNMSWKLKKLSNPWVTNATVDSMIALGLKSGAIGGKLLGAGASGFILFLVHPMKQQFFRKRLASATVLRASIDFDGSTTIFESDPNNEI